MRCCSSFTPGLLNPAFKPLGGRGTNGFFINVLGPDGLTNGLLKFDPGFLNPLIITSAFFSLYFIVECLELVCFLFLSTLISQLSTFLFLKSFSIVSLINLPNSSIDITPISPLPCCLTATFPSAASFSPTTSM